MSVLTAITIFHNWSCCDLPLKLRYGLHIRYISKIIPHLSEHLLEKKRYCFTGSNRKCYNVWSHFFPSTQEENEIVCTVTPLKMSKVVLQCYLLYLPQDLDFSVM